ncbi:hypothetical protein GGF37_006011 [Kickxella alabastrina]|nr:hypothetical protein GGF37_006011 [Kickxella alabastrina]
MARFPVSLVETSSQGIVVFVSENNFSVADSAGKIIASTSESQANSNNVTKISGPSDVNSNPSDTTIRAASFSRDGRLFAICTADKGIMIYDTKTWAVQRQLKTEKRTNAICFDPQGAFLVTADKFGDSYRIPTVSEGPTEMLLGHVSILCSLGFSYGSPTYVLSCDRDEKLRVSKYPNAYNIEAFGLGHREFVTSVATAEFAPTVAVTGSGDGTVRLWRISTGELLQTIELAEYLRVYYENGKALCGENTFHDRSAATERYGVLRVRAVEALSAFVVAVERIPALLVLPMAEDSGFGRPMVVDLEAVPTDVAALGDRVIVSFVTRTDQGALVTAIKRDGEAFGVDGELARALAENIVTREAESVPEVQSIFVWGNKMFLERPQEENEDEDAE